MRLVSRIETSELNGHHELVLKPRRRAFASVLEAVQTAEKLDTKFCLHCPLKKPEHHLGTRCSRVVATALNSEISVNASIPKGKEKECGMARAFE